MKFRKILMYCVLYVVSMSLVASIVVMRLESTAALQQPVGYMPAPEIVETGFEKTLGKFLGAEDITLSLDAELSKDGSQKLQVSADVAVVMGDELKIHGQLSCVTPQSKQDNNINTVSYKKTEKNEIAINFTYINNAIYIEAMGGMYYLQAADLNSMLDKLVPLMSVLGSGEQGTNLLPADMDLDALMTNVMGALSQVAETDTGSGYIYTLCIEGIGDINFETDYDYNIKQINTSNITFGDFTLKASAGVKLNDSVQVFVPQNAEDYIDITQAMDLLAPLKKILDNKKISAEIAVDCKGEKITGDIILDFSNDIKLEVNATYRGQKAKVIILGGKLYVEVGLGGNLLFVHDIDKLDEAAQIIGDSFGLNIPIELIQKLTNALQTDYKIDTSSLFTLTGIDFGAISLDIFSSISYFDGQISATLKSGGQVEIAYADKLNIDFNSSDLKVSLKINENFKEIKPSYNSNSYLNINDVSNLIAAAKNTFDAGAIEGKAKVTIKDFAAEINYKIVYKNNKIQAQLTTNLYGADISITYLDENIYADIAGLKVVAHKDDLDKLLAFASQSFDVQVPQLSEIDFDIDSILDSVLSKLAITAMSKDTLSVSYNDVVVTANFSDKIDGAVLNAKDINVQIGVDNLGEDIIIENIEPEKYESVQKYLDLIAEANKLFESGKISAEIDITYQGKVYNAELSLDISQGLKPENIKARVFAKILDRDIEIIYNCGDIYAIVDGLKVKACISDLSEIKLLLNELDIELPELDIDELLSSLINNTKTIAAAEGSLKLTVQDLAKVDIQHQDGKLVKVRAEYKDIKANIVLKQYQDESYEIADKENYSSLCDLLPVAKGAYKLYKAGGFRFTGFVDVKINGEVEHLALNGAITYSDKILKAQVSTELYGLQADIKIIDKTIYADIAGLKVQASIDDIADIYTWVIETFGIENAKELDLDNMLSKLSLGMIKSFGAQDNVLSIDTDIADANIYYNGDKITNLSANVKDINVSIDVDNSGDITIEVTEPETYQDIQKYLDLAADAYGIYEKGKISAEIDITYQGKVYNAELSLDISQGLKPENIKARVFTKILDRDIEIIYNCGDIYAIVDGLKVKACISDLSEIKLLLNELDIELPELDIDELLSSLINNTKTIAAAEGSLKLTVQDLAKVDIQHQDGKLVKVRAEYKDIKANIVLKQYQDESYEIADKENYSSLCDLLPVAKGAYKLYKAGGFRFTGFVDVKINGEVERLALNGAITYSDKILKAQVSTELYGLQADIKIIDKTIYADIAGLKVQASIDDIADIYTWVIETFGIKDAKEIDFIKLQDNMLEDLSLSMIKSFVANDNVLTISTEILDANIGFNYSNEITNASVAMNDFAVAITSINSGAFVAEPNAAEFAYYQEFTKAIDGLWSYITKKQFDISGKVMVYNHDNQVKYDMNFDRFVGDYSNKDNVALYGKAVVTGIKARNAELSYKDNYLYFDYSGMKLKISENSLKQILYIVCEIMGMDANVFAFLNGMGDGINVDTDNIAHLIPSINLDNPLKMLSFIKSLNMVKDGDKQIYNLVLNSSKISGKEINKDIVITLTMQDNKPVSVIAQDFYTGLSENEYFNAQVTFNDYSGVPTISDTSKFIDISTSIDFIKATINTAGKTNFHVSGYLNVKITMLFSFEWNVKTDVYIKKLEDNSTIIKVVLDNIPVEKVLGIYSVNLDVKDQTEGSNRDLTIYIMDGMMYFYRSETAKIKTGLFSSKTITYQKTIKSSIETVLSDPLKYLRFATGFNGTIMDAIKQSIDKMLNRTTPIDFANILKGYNYANSYYNLTLNMEEITNDTNFNDMVLNLALKDDAANIGKKELDHLKFTLYLDVVNLINIDLKSKDKFTLNTSMTDAQMDAILNDNQAYLIADSYPVDQEWETDINGKWVQKTKNYN